MAVGSAETFPATNSQIENQRGTISELDWRLLQVIGHYKYTNNISYNRETGVFEAIFYESVFAVSGNSPDKLRESMEMKIRLLNGLLGKYFPAFRKRGSIDLRATILLGRRGGDHIAEYDGATLRFTDDYYNYLREIGRRF